MSGGGKEALFPLWKYCDRFPGAKGSGGTSNIVCKLCGKAWQGTYSRVRAHFYKTTGKGVGPCTADDENRLEAVREQDRADGKLPPFSSHGSASPTTQSQHTREREEPEIDVTSRDTMHEAQDEGSSRKKAHHSKRPNPIVDLYDVKGRDAVDAAIARFFYANGIPFNVARSPYYEEMVHAISSAPTGYKPPGSEKLRTVLIDKEKTRLEQQVAPIKNSWLIEGCSIVMDGWTDTRNRPLLNIMVTSIAGPYFLKAIDCSGQEKNADFLKDQLCVAIEEVGPSHVVQIITDAAPVCKAAGMLIQKQYKHIFWTPCCVHALNNALKDIGKFDWIAKLIENGRKIQMFICNHHQSQAIYRRYAKVELLKPADTRFASFFILLERLLSVKGALCSTVVSDAWAAWKQSSTESAVQVRQMVLDEHFWADIKFVVAFVEPICEMIRFADSDRPCLGEIYENIDSMCEKIKKVTNMKDASLYPLIETKIHGRWNKLNTPLHMAAYALNPKWYDVEVTKKRPPCKDKEVMDGFWTAVKKIYGQGEEASILRTQWSAFSRGLGDFGSVEALYDRRKKNDPIEWWYIHGTEALELQSFAIRLLSQVASSSSCERNWSTYSFIHSLKRNRLGSKKAENLVYIHSTLRLLSRKDPRYKDGPSAKWDQIPSDGDELGLEDVADEFDGLNDLPIVRLPTEDLELESDEYLESILAEDLEMGERVYEDFDLVDE